MTRITAVPRAPTLPDRDGDLVAKLRRQAPGAVETLVARYGALLYRLAVGITGNEQGAEETVQDTLCAAVYRIESFRHESAFASWLYRMAAIAAFAARRQRRHGRQHQTAQPNRRRSSKRSLHGSLLIASRWRPLSRLVFGQDREAQHLHRLHPITLREPIRQPR